jgi:hypothetical protein
MIEEFGKMIGHVMGLKSMNQNQLALDELHDAYKTYFELNAEFLHAAPVEGFLALIIAKVELRQQHQEALAKALMTEGELLNESDPLLAKQLRQKALQLYIHLEQTDTATFSISRKEAISELTSILASE